MDDKINEFVKMELGLTLENVMDEFKVYGKFNVVKGVLRLMEGKKIGYDDKSETFYYAD